jgi:hypothetical protein
MPERPNCESLRFPLLGTSEIAAWKQRVPLDSSFGEAANAALAYHVFLTPNGDSNGLYVARKTPTGFEVREQGGGSANVAFDYRIVVRRRGFESVRMAEVQHDVRTVDASRQHLAQFVTYGIPREAAATKPPRNIQAPTIRPVPPRPSVPNPSKPNIPQPPGTR